MIPSLWAISCSLPQPERAEFARQFEAARQKVRTPDDFAEFSQFLYSWEQTAIACDESRYLGFVKRVQERGEDGSCSWEQAIADRYGVTLEQAMERWLIYTLLPNEQREWYWNSVFSPAGE